MDDKGASGRNLPPYLGFGTLQNFLESLRQGIPSRIDRSLMQSLGGTVQKQLLHALRYLGLIGEFGLPQPRLKPLVEAEGPERERIWRDLLQTAYPFLYGEAAGGFDLTTTTPRQLTEKFQATGLQGESIRKAEAFFLRGAEQAGIAISRHIPSRSYRPGRALGQLARPRNGQKPRKRPEAEKSQLVSITNNSGPPLSQGQPPMMPHAEVRQALLQSLITKMPEFDPTWDQETQKKWLETFDRVAERLLTVTDEA
jgi:hypothetical protein